MDILVALIKLKAYQISHLRKLPHFILYISYTVIKVANDMRHDDYFSLLCIDANRDINKFSSSVDQQDVSVSNVEKYFFFLLCLR